MNRRKLWIPNTCKDNVTDSENSDTEEEIEDSIKKGVKCAIKCFYLNMNIYLYVYE